MVVMPLSDLQLIHAKRIVANDLLRERAQMVAIQRNLVDGLKMQIGIREQEAAKARQDAGIAWEAAATCKDENVTLQRKNKRLRGWATAMKVQLGMIVIGGGIVAYKSIVP